MPCSKVQGQKDGGVREGEKEWIDTREREIEIDRGEGGREEGGNRPQETQEESFEFYV